MKANAGPELRKSLIDQVKADVFALSLYARVKVCWVRPGLLRKLERSLGYLPFGAVRAARGLAIRWR